MHWTLPTDGPKTLHGLILVELETIPEPGTRVTVASYPIEILETAEHAIRRVRIFRRGTAIPEELPAAVAGR
jgi:Mg2+/Co2+ transporter CorB